MSGHNPTLEEGRQVAEQAVKVAREELDQRGFTWDYLAPYWKGLLEAKHTEIIKFKGRILNEQEVTENGHLTNGCRFKRGNGDNVRIIAEGKKIEVDKAGQIYDDGETVIAIDEVSNDIRLKALVEIHRMKGDYPAEKHEHSGPNGSQLPLQELRVVFVGPLEVSQSKEKR